jgi:hypothetical protein
LNRRLGRFRRAHRDERKTAGLLRELVGDDVDFRHGTAGSEKILQFQFAGFEGKVSDEQLSIHDDNALTDL